MNSPLIFVFIAFAFLAMLPVAFLWPALQPNRILYEPMRMEDPAEFEELNDFVNEAARTGHYFEQLIDENSTRYYIKRSINASYGALRPYHYHRFEQPNGQFRVMCRVLHGWIHNLTDSQWHRAMYSITNVFAFSMVAHPTGIENDIVCEFVKTTDEYEAACLFTLHQLKIVTFPEAEYVPRIHNHNKMDLLPLDARERKAEKEHPYGHHHVLDATYCHHFWTSIGWLIFWGVLAVCFLAAVGYFAHWMVIKPRYTRSYWHDREARRERRRQSRQLGSLVTRVGGGGDGGGDTEETVL